VNILFFISHPIQYFTPLYKKLAEEMQDRAVKVYFLSDETLKPVVDKGFGARFAWDIPLLQGYTYKFVPNDAPKPSIFNGFWGLMNFRLIKILKEEKPAWIVVPGWQFFSYVLLLIIGPYYGHRVCLRTETPLKHESHKKTIVHRLRVFFIRRVVFPRVSKFLYIGKENKAFYQSYGVPEEKMIFTPYAVDNERFRMTYATYKEHKNVLRKELGIPEESIIFLTTGKYIEKKNPLDVIKAFSLVQHPEKYLVMVGEGHLRPEMEALIRANSLPVLLTGFINQTEITKYYAAADVFIMASGIGETWGLSVNEAMNYELPVIVYEQTGCAADLVLHGQNGFIVPNSDIIQLAARIQEAAVNQDWREKAGKVSGELIKNYDYNVVVEEMQRHLT
jgi:glycosyltransferase involved in cell wall biosynthesis